jgi:hypothetical protein
MARHDSRTARRIRGSQLIINNFINRLLTLVFDNGAGNSEKSFLLLILLRDDGDDLSPSSTQFKSRALFSATLFHSVDLKVDNKDPGIRFASPCYRRFLNRRRNPKPAGLRPAPMGRRGRFLHRPTSFVITMSADFVEIGKDA